MRELKSVWPKLNKQDLMRSYIEQVNRHEFDECVAIITETVCLTCDEWDEFRQSLMQNRDWLAGKGGCRGMRQRYVVLVVRPGVTPAESTGVFVDPQGYNYARYVGFYLSPERKVTNVPDLPTIEEAMYTTLGGVTYKDRVLKQAADAHDKRVAA